MSLPSTITIPVLLSVLLFTGCSTPPQKAIVNRWKAYEVSGNRKQASLRIEKHHPEIEFMEDGKCNFYQDGIMQTSIAYTIAPDGKSLVLKDPSGREDMPVEIISLGSDKLIITSKMFGNDTLTYKAR